jgi:predicted short-subunit dehydrogenase-like oxidoreductase (DUF2520 family)
VGTALGMYLTQQGGEVTGYFSRSTDSAARSAELAGTKAYERMGDLVHDSDVLFLTVPDGSITSVYEEVCGSEIRGKFICHCSGALTSAGAFPGIGDRGAFGYSIHPLFAVSDSESACREMPDVFFTVEGDEDHLAEIMDHLRRSGLRVRSIDPAAKPRYHLAASVASNLVVALLDMSFELLGECGFSRDEAREALAPLVTGNVSHVLQDGAAGALTGPVERGDAGTVAEHLSCLGGDDRRIYALLSLRLADIAAKKHPEADQSYLRELLEEYAK